VCRSFLTAEPKEKLLENPWLLFFPFYLAINGNI